MATFVKKITVGTPIRAVTSGAFSINNIDGVEISGGLLGSGDSGDILVYSASRDEYLNTNTLTDFRVGQLSFKDDSIASGSNPVVFNQVPELKNPDAVFDSADVTSKAYVDREVEKVKHVIFTTDDNFTDSVHTYDDETIRVLGGNGITTKGRKLGSVYNLTIDLDSTNAVDGTYGSATQIPIIKINELGLVDSVGTTAVAGVTSFTYDSSSGLLTINTADGNSFTDSINLNPFTTAGLTEGSNLYYTRGRFDSALGDSTSRQTIRNYFSTSGDLQYNPATGVISVDVEQVYTKGDFDSDLDAAIENSANIHWYPDSNYFDLGETGVDSGTYGSATEVPVFTVDKYGRLDSISTIAVAGVDSTRWIPSSRTYRISTADGQVFNTTIDQFGGGVATGVHLVDETTLFIGGDSSNRLQAPTHLYFSNFFDNFNIYSRDKNIYITTPETTFTGNVIPHRDANQNKLGDSDQRWSEIHAVELLSDSATISGPLTADSTNINGPLNVTGQVEVTGNLIPGADSTYDLGSPTRKWRDLHLSGSSLFLGTLTVRDSDGNMAIHGPGNGPVEISASRGVFDSSYIGQLTVDSLNVGQMDLDSVKMNQLNVTAGDIDTLIANQLTSDSAFISNLNVVTGDIDNAVLGQVTVDSAYITNLNVITGDIDTGVFGQVTIDSAHATRLDVQTAYAYRLTSDSARIENFSADILNADSVSVGFIKFDQVAYDDNIKPSNVEGAVYYNSGPDALVYKPSTASPIKIGQDNVTRVYNNTGAMIPKGTPVYVTGAANDFPTIAKAKADAIGTIAETIGVLKDSINNAAFGFAVSKGLVGRIDTSAFAAGSNVFVSADSEGKFTSTAPAFPNFAYRIGTVLVSDSLNGPGVGGCIQIDPFREFFEEFRVTGSGRVDQNFTIGGNLTVIGSQVQTSVQSLAVSDTVIEMGAGDTIGLAATNYAGTGNNDGSLVGHYTGDDVVTFHVRIDSVGSGGEGDKIQWSFDSQYGSLEPFDSAAGPTSFVLSSGDKIAGLANGVNISFTAETGHNLNDSWNGEASPINVQIGIVGNYNPPDDSHAYSGLIRDPSDSRWKFFTQYLPDPQANINFGDQSLEYAQVQLGTLHASTVNADLTGDVTGTVSDISNHSTTNLSEGNNLYYTTLRADSDFDVRLATKSTNNLTEGSNLYYTTARAINDFNFRLSQISTDSLSEGSTNLYYTTARADSDARHALSSGGDISYDPATGIISIDVEQIYTKANFDSDLGTASTTDLPEGTNRYFTDARVDSSIQDSIATDNLHVTTGYIGQFTSDSAIITDISGTTLNYNTIVRSGATDYSGIYGSASLVPILTVDSSGFIDSIGTTSVAGVTGFTWDNSNTATITTADGGSFAAYIDDFDSATIGVININGSTITSSDSLLLKGGVSGFVIQDNGGNDLARQNNNALVLYHNGSQKFTSDAYGATVTGRINADSATVNIFTVENDATSNSALLADSAVGAYNISRGTISRSYKNTGDGEDSSNDPIINLYLRTAAKTSNHRYFGTGSANGYYMAYDSDGLRTSREMQSPHLDLIAGRTYRFHFNDSSMSTHDLRFYYDDARNGAMNSDSAAFIEYKGASGDKNVGNSYAQIRVKDNGPRAFAYQCINHPYMGNSVTTNATGGSRIIGSTSGIKVDGTIEGTIDGGVY